MDDEEKKGFDLKSLFWKAAKWTAATLVGVFTVHALIEGMAHRSDWYGPLTANLADIFAPGIGLLGSAAIALAKPFGLDYLMTDFPEMV